jgi:hypothetical protein
LGGKKRWLDGIEQLPKDLVHDLPTNGIEQMVGALTR